MGTLDDLRNRFRRVERDGSVVKGGTIQTPYWTAEQITKWAARFDVQVLQRIPAKSRGAGGDRYEVADLRLKFGGPMLEGRKLSELVATNRGALRWLHEEAGIPEEVRRVIRYQLQETEETLKMKLESVDSKG